MLDRFYRRVRPGGPGWRQVRDRLGFGDDPIPGGALSWVNWVAGRGRGVLRSVRVGAFLTGSRSKAACSTEPVRWRLSR